MGKFKTVNELVNSIQPDYPVYCLRLNEIKKSVRFFKDNFPGKYSTPLKRIQTKKLLNRLLLMVLMNSMLLL